MRGPSRSILVVSLTALLFVLIGCGERSEDAQLEAELKALAAELDTKDSNLLLPMTSPSALEVREWLLLGDVRGFFGTEIDQLDPGEITAAVRLEMKKPRTESSLHILDFGGRDFCALAMNTDGFEPSADTLKWCTAVERAR